MMLTELCKPAWNVCKQMHDTVA